jgi:hypothetical protein
MQHYVIKFVSDLWLVCSFLRVLQFPPPNLPPRYNWNIVDSGGKHYNPKPLYINYPDSGLYSYCIIVEKQQIPIL